MDNINSNSELTQFMPSWIESSQYKKTLRVVGFSENECSFNTGDRS